MKPDDGGDGPFAAHLREAIQLNLQRRPLYARLSGGASEVVSRRLIRAERRALPVARWFDQRAAPWERRGVPVLSDAFVSMSGVPAWDGSLLPAPAPPPPLPGVLEVARLGREVWAGLRRAGADGGVDGATPRLRSALDRLPPSSCYGCLLRHLLESALRVALLAPLRADQARAGGLASPLGLYRQLLAAHLLVLPQAAVLDRTAAPLQARGIPILCVDLPAIPLSPSP